MKNIFKILFLCILVYSCSNAYDIQPDDEILEENAFNNIDDLEKGIIGVYANISGYNLIEWSSIISDDTRITNQNRGQGVAVHGWSIVSGTGESTGLWNNLYSVINRANRVLEALDRVEAINEDEQAIKDRIKAECKAIRAMSHFDLFRLFSQDYSASSQSVPVVTSVTVFEQPARNTVQEVLTAVKMDLSEAYNTLSEDYTDNTRFTKTAITALRARVALYEGEYQDAIDFSTEVIDNNALATTAEFGDIWTDASNAEVLFKLARTNGNAAVGTIFKDTNGDVFFGMSIGLLDHIFNFGWTGDVRTFSNIDVPNYDPANPQFGKYVGTDANYGLNDIKLFRVGEQYLIRAEAYARNNQLSLAADDIETLRNTRKNAPVNVDYNDLDIALDDILGERRMELAVEGHRFFDLKRFGKDIDRTEFPEDCELAAGACLLESNDHRFSLPIPQSELFANDNMTQNTGY